MSSSNIPTEAFCRTFDGYIEFIFRPSKPSYKINLQFLATAESPFDIVAVEPALNGRDSNWGKPNESGLISRPLGRSDDLGIRRVEVLATLNPVTEYKFRLEPTDNSSELNSIQFMTAEVLDEDGSRRSLGILPLNTEARSSSSTEV